MNFPFYYKIIDNFFNQEQAKRISKEFPDYNSDVWFFYNNPLENKKTCNNWYSKIQRFIDMMQITDI